MLVVYRAVTGVPVQGVSDRLDIDRVVAGVDNYYKRSGVTHQLSRVLYNDRVLRGKISMLAIRKKDINSGK
jgi:hypothetical protein